jgi:hypothetical protein
MLILSALLPPLGAALVSRRLYGRWSFWQAWSGLIAWPLVLLTGFMSLDLAFGAALLCLWLDLRLDHQGRWLKLIRQSAQVLLILLVHPFGAMFYGLIAFGVWLGPDLRAWRAQPLRDKLRGFGLLIAPFLIAALLLVARILIFRQGDSADLGLPRLSWYDPPLSQMGPDHLFWGFVAPLRTYRLGVDLVFIALLWLPVIIALALKRLSAHGGLVATGLGLFVFSLICPQGIGDTSMVDLRLATMAWLILPVAVLPRLDEDARLKNLMPMLALLVLAGRSAWLTLVWYGRQADVRAVETVLSAVPAGARLMPLAEPDADAPPLGRNLADMTPTWSHLDALAVRERHAYVPTLFAEAGKQPLRVLAPFDADNEPSGGLLATPDDLRAGRSGAAAYLPHWRSDFDYVLLLNADSGPAPDIPGAGLVRDAGFAKLYRITP